jgi:hypothetical protein
MPTKRDYAVAMSDLFRTSGTAVRTLLLLSLSVVVVALAIQDTEVADARTTITVKESQYGQTLGAAVSVSSTSWDVRDGSAYGTRIATIRKSGSRLQLIDGIDVVATATRSGSNWVVREGSYGSPYLTAVRRGSGWELRDGSAYGQRIGWATGGGLMDGGVAALAGASFV